MSSPTHEDDDEISMLCNDVRRLLEKFMSEQAPTIPEPNLTQIPMPRNDKVNLFKAPLSARDENKNDKFFGGSALMDRIRQKYANKPGATDVKETKYLPLPQVTDVKETKYLPLPQVTDVKETKYLPLPANKVFYTLRELTELT